MTFGSSHRHIGLITLLTLLASSMIGMAWAKDDFLRPEQAYRYSTRLEGDQLIVTWQIEKGYYLYKNKLGISAAAPGQLGAPQWPKGEDHKDEYFGSQEIYRGKVAVPVAVSFNGARPAKLPIELKLQGCADAGLCYPPLKWKTEVAVPAVATNTAANWRSVLEPKGTSGNQDEFLPPDQAFKLTAQIQDGQIALGWIIAPEYYLYKERISLSTDTPGVQLGQPKLPRGDPKHDEYFGDTEVYHEVVDVSVPVVRTADSGETMSLKVTYQGCAEAGLCYNPISKNVELQLASVPIGNGSGLVASPNLEDTAARSAGSQPVAEQDSLAALVRSGSLLALLATFFGGGLVLAFTPCVLPMIPILSGIIVGQGGQLTARRGFSLAFTYVQGMALTYAAAGAVFALLFKQAPQATFQQPWILTLFAVLFVALALAMFGAFTLELPSSLQTRLTNVSNQQKTGTYVGTFVMGALSALIVTACVAPAIVAALSVIAQAGDVARGAGALYATGLGMGTPLLLVGASAGSLLPRVGPWMDTMKSMFGVVFLGVAIYVLNPLLPAAASMLLWSALALISGFWIFSLKARDGAPVASPARAVGLLMLIYGVILLLGLASGGRDPLQPLGNLRVSAAGGVAGAAEHGLVFQRVKTVADLERAVAAASAAGKPVMFDFYADWCVACKEMEKFTFSDSAVRSALANAVLLQADVTANDADDKALLARFDVFGPPTIAFFGSDGLERKNFRVVGFLPAAKFSSHVSSALAG
jgi:thioredoxin:protein disulfide reductase